MVAGVFGFVFADWHGAITLYPPEIALLIPVPPSSALALVQD